MSVLPEAFVPKMEEVWIRQYGNVSSPAFREMWLRMGETFHAAILRNLERSRLSIDPGWLVLAPEMGVGKTAGALLYLSMMAQTARTLPERLKIGGLFATRTITQCEDAVRQINAFAGYNAAITRHSENKVSITDCANYPVLVVTHAALIQSVAVGRAQFTDHFRLWIGGPRGLTVIDEALANAVEFHELTEDSLHAVLAQIKGDLRRKHETLYEILFGLLEHVRAVSASTTEAYPMWEPVSRDNEAFNVILPSLVKELKTDLFAERDDRRIWADAEVRIAELTQVAKTLDAVVELFRSWALFNKRGSDAGMLTANAYLPRVYSPVLLNATANQDILLDYRRAKIVPLPRVRDYANLTIKTLRTGQIGKTSMRAKANQRMQRLGDFIASNSQPGDKWLIVTHLDVEAVARKHISPDLAITAHWGALDGSNAFVDCNKAVLFGLSYRPPIWPRAMYFALRGVQENDWHDTPEGNAVARTMRRKSIAAQIIQAIGRPRCRKVIDASGNCLPTEIYLTLPNGALGREIEQEIRNELPGVRIGEWAYSLDAESPDARRGGSYQEAVVVHMRNKPHGRYRVDDIANELQLSKSQKTNLKTYLRQGREIVNQLTAIGIEYVSEGRGRSARSYLVKR